MRVVGLDFNCNAPVHMLISTPNRYISKVHWPRESRRYYHNQKLSIQLWINLPSLFTICVFMLLSFFYVISIKTTVYVGLSLSNSIMSPYHAYQLIRNRLLSTAKVIHLEFKKKNCTLTKKSIFCGWIQYILNSLVDFITRVILVLVEN